MPRPLPPPHPRHRPGWTWSSAPIPPCGTAVLADNAWLQELPKPLSKLVWENAVQIGPELAARLGLASGDVVEITCDGHTASGPALIMPGQADNVVCLTLGYGRRVAAQLSAGLGYDAYAARPPHAPWAATGATLRRLGPTHMLASTQAHARMDADGLVRVQRQAAAAVGDGDAQPATLYPQADSNGRAWGMVIDIDACIGCNACVTACQSENNIAVVGRDEVMNGREMHWLRVDAYPDAIPGAGAAQTAFMPVPCMHCEQAPCEVGCPVEAHAARP